MSVVDIIAVNSFDVIDNTDCYRKNDHLIKRFKKCLGNDHY